MISLIGNAPSSGSTLLADLFDSTGESACGAELNLFSNNHFYNFKRFQRDITRSSPSSSIYTSRVSLNTHRLYSYGLNTEEFNMFVQNSSDIHEFSELFSKHFLTLRGKDHSGVVFEKTPENINCLEHYKSHFPNGVFIFLLRNPLYLFVSLLKRNFPTYIALATWLIDVAKYIKYKDTERVVLLRYENLVQDPFNIISKILNEDFNLTIPADRLQENYKNNQYRAFHSNKLSSWTYTDTGKVWNANQKQLSKADIRTFASVKNLKIHPKYAAHFGLPEISYIEAMETFSLESQILPMLPTESPPLRKSRNDLRKLLKKWLKDFYYRDANIFDMRFYLNPLVRN